MRATLTISLPLPLRRNVSRAAKKQHMTESEFVRDALKRRLWDEAFEKTSSRRPMDERAATRDLSKEFDRKEWQW